MGVTKKERRSLQVCGWERLIAQVGVILQGKSKLAVSEVAGWRRRVVEPLKEVAEGEEALVECFHDLRIRVLGAWGDLAADRIRWYRPMLVRYAHIGSCETSSAFTCGALELNSSSESSSSKRSSSLVVCLLG